MSSAGSPVPEDKPGMAMLVYLCFAVYCVSLVPRPCSEKSRRALGRSLPRNDYPPMDDFSLLVLKQ